MTLIGPGVSIIDLCLPGFSGMETIRVLARNFPNRAFALMVFREAILEAIRTVHQGRQFIPPDAAGCLAEPVRGPESTNPECELLGQIARGNSNKQIAADLAFSEGTVNGHVNGILSKLRVEDRTEMSPGRVTKELRASSTLTAPPSMRGRRKRK